MRLKEFKNTQPDLIQAFRDFFPIAMKELGLEKLPKIHLEKIVNDTEQPTFGRFENEAEVIYLGISGRHPLDILRTLAHELVHYKQHVNGELNDQSGDTGSPEENEAHIVAGVIMRNFNKQHSQYFKDTAVSISESRSNPDQNPKTASGMKELEAVAKTIADPVNWAISMTAEPKLGINPQVGISEDTPKGIYFYPLDYAVDMARRGKKLPWGDNMPYIQLFQYDRSGEMTKETQVDPARLKQALGQYCPAELIQQVIDEPDSLYDNTPYWFIYDCLSRLGKSDETNIVRWNKVLRDLGFTSVFDPGAGWIAYGEPTQGVVLDPRIIKQHKTISNKKQSKVVTPAVIEQAIFDTLDIELAANRAWQAYDPDGSKLRQAAKEYAKKPEFKQWFGKPGSEEIFDKAASWGRYGARELSQEAWEWYKAQQAQTATENFADGKNPQDKGDSKRHGVPTKASVSTLRKVAKQGGRKGQLAHWMANMKAGKAKK